MYPSLRDLEVAKLHQAELRREASQERLVRLASGPGPSSGSAGGVRLRLGLVFVRIGAWLVKEPPGPHAPRRLNPTL